MKAYRVFSINHAGLREGQHRFDYDIDKSFLELFESPLVEDLQVRVELLLNKEPGFIDLNFNWEGTVAACCDLCNEDFDLPISGQEHIIVKFVQEIPADNTEPEIIYIQSGESSINIAMPLYEALMLSIPMRKVHPEDEKGTPICNPEVLALLQGGQKGTEDKDDDDDEEGGGSIWDELKNWKK